MKKSIYYIFALIIAATSNLVIAQNIDIPDTNFKNALIAAGVDKNRDGVIQESEALLVTSLDVSKAVNSNYVDAIFDLTGIEYFTNLISLNCTRNQISILNIDGLTKLTKLHCGSNKLINLDLSNLTKLGELDCSFNDLTTLNISSLTDITILNYSGNKLPNLDISKLTKLISLNCNSNKISSLDISKLTNLTTLSCGFNSLTTLDVSKILKLTELTCNRNQITSLDISMLTNIKKLNCSENKLTNLNIGNITGLTDLNCSKNQLPGLDLSKFSSLTNLNCSENKLTTLNLGNITSLIDLNCSKNLLTNLDVNNQFNLTKINCSSNKLTNINLPNHTNLSYLNCSSNLMTSLNLNPLVNLTSLYCSNNKLTSLNLNNQPKLYSLYCDSNQITNLDLSNQTRLTSLTCSVNQLSNLDVSKSTNLYSLNCASNKLTSLTLGSLPELKYLECQKNQLTNLDVSLLPVLEEFNCSNNKLTVLNLEKSPNLTILDCSHNKLNQLDVNNSKNIYHLFANNNLFKTLDLNLLTELWLLDITNNELLEALYIKNGHDDYFYDLYEWDDYIEYNFNMLEGNDNLKYICTDNNDTQTLIHLINYLWEFRNEYYDIIVSSLCNSTTTGTTNYLMGKIKYDANSDGCNKLDKAFPSIKVKISNPQDSVILISGDNGNFSTYLGPGSYTSRPILKHPDYYTVSPQSITFSLPDTTSPVFCIAPKGNFNDLAVSIIPVRAARPGFSDASYKIVYKNQGTTTQNGTVTFSFDDDKMNVISSSPSANQSDFGLLTFNFTNLAPFETKSAWITMRTNAPTDNPAVNVNDVLNFSANITAQTDQTPDDNIAILYQTVIGSYDPNDKTCLQGDIITPDMVGKRVNYLIRFENTGTAPAENVVVTDYIDTTVFDVNSLLVTDASHTCHTQISKGNKVQFIFSDIHLPFTEPDKHGYVAFSILLKDNLQIGDSIKNYADIYFDYNLPITTNEAVSEVKNRVITSVKQKISDATLLVYPNPSKGSFSVELKSNKTAPVQISVIDIEGKIVFAKQYAQQQNIIPLQLNQLAQGTYLIRAEIDNDIISKKIVIY